MKPKPGDSSPALSAHPVIGKLRTPRQPARGPLDFKSRALLLDLAVAFTRRPREGLRREGGAIGFQARD